MSAMPKMTAACPCGGVFEDIRDEVSGALNGPWRCNRCDTCTPTLEPYMPRLPHADLLERIEAHLVALKHLRMTERELDHLKLMEGVLARIRDDHGRRVS